jgi:hypothetical protein
MVSADHPVAKDSEPFGRTDVAEPRVWYISPSGMSTAVRSAWVLAGLLATPACKESREHAGQEPEARTAAELPAASAPASSHEPPAVPLLDGGPRSSDAFAGYADLALRDAIAQRKDFGSRWAPVLGDTDKTADHYLWKGTAPVFHGAAIDKAVLSVSKKMQVVVAFALSLSGDRCAAIERALDAAWGDAFLVGGAHHEVEWEGKHVDASLDHDGTTCFLYVADRLWDDGRDVFKQP